MGHISALAGATACWWPLFPVIIFFVAKWQISEHGLTHRCLPQSFGIAWANEMIWDSIWDRPGVLKSVSGYFQPCEESGLGTSKFYINPCYYGSCCYAQNISMVEKSLYFLPSTLCYYGADQKRERSRKVGLANILGYYTLQFSLNWQFTNVNTPKWALLLEWVV